MHTLRILFILLAISGMVRAQAPAPTATALDPRVKSLVEEARVLQQNQRSFEALKKLDEAETVTPDSAFIANVRGSIYTAPPLRDYAKAKECFDKAEKLMPAAFEPKFNKSELLYVQHKYAEAEEGFSKLLKDFQKLREEVRHLVQFKVLACHLKIGNAAEAEKAAKGFTFMDDTPAYYYAKAAFALAKNNADEAKPWLDKAGRIFKAQQNAVYLDTMIEAGWLNSVGSNDPKAESK